MEHKNIGLENVIQKLKEIMEQKTNITMISRVSQGISHIYYGKILYIDEIGNLGIRACPKKDKQDELFVGLTINCQDFNEYYADEKTISMIKTGPSYGDITIIIGDHRFRYWGKDLDPEQTYFFQKKK